MITNTQTKDNNLHGCGKGGVNCFLIMEVVSKSIFNKQKLLDAILNLSEGLKMRAINAF